MVSAVVSRVEYFVRELGSANENKVTILIRIAVQGKMRRNEEGAQSTKNRISWAVVSL
jgi:hypothetical protein